MKKPISGIAERMELPAEALSGELRVTLTGNSLLVMENHGGILEYGEGRIVLAAGRKKLAVTGSSLVITAMNRSELALKGEIVSVEIM